LGREGETKVLVQDCAVVDLDAMENNLRRRQTHPDDRIYAARQGRVESFHEVAARGKAP
jgi:hypothetical protein